RRPEGSPPRRRRSDVRRYSRRGQCRAGKRDRRPISRTPCAFPYLSVGQVNKRVGRLRRVNASPEFQLARGKHLKILRRVNVDGLAVAMQVTDWVSCGTIAALHPQDELVYGV